MVLNGEGVMDLRFQDRYKLVEREVARPRDLERAYAASPVAAGSEFVYLPDQVSG